MFKKFPKLPGEDRRDIASNVPTAPHTPANQNISRRPALGVDPSAAPRSTRHPRLSCYHPFDIRPQLPDLLSFTLMSTALRRL